MSVYDVILKRRSIRRFKQKAIPETLLKKLINAARHAPSGANLQPCEFILINKKQTLKGIFSTLKWAGYIRPLGDPPKDKRPAAYIVVLINNKKNPLTPTEDAAAAVENILLVAVSHGVGSCWLGSIDKNKIRRILKIPSYCEVKYVIALGYPDEKPKIETAKDSIKYYKDRKGTLCVPKRPLGEVLGINKYK